MEIFSPQGSKILDAAITVEAQHVQEMMRSDFVRLSWHDTTKQTILIGSYIIHNGEKYILLDDYSPNDVSEVDFKYDVEFQHQKMILGRMPFALNTTNSVGEPIKEYDWNMTDKPSAILAYLCLRLNDDFGIDNWGFQLLSPFDVVSATCTFSNMDYLSALTEICSKFSSENNKVEYLIDWDRKQIYLGVNISIGQSVILKVGDNIQTPSVSLSKDSYYNRFIVKGSSRNIWQRSVKGESVSTNTRLSLDKVKYPNGYIDKAKAGEPILTKVLVYDDIYPKLDLYVYDVRERNRFLLDDNGAKVIDHYATDGKPIYKTFSVWYIRLAYPVYNPDKTIKEWRDFHATKELVLDGYALMAAFIANEQGRHSALAGRDFKMYYHTKGDSIPTNETTGDTGVIIKKGDYEINFDKETGDIIIPTTSKQGLIPFGEQLPTLLCDKVVLYNLAMSDEYLSSAQKELEAQALKDISVIYSDKNNYTFKSNPVEFEKANPDLYIGRSVIYEDINGHKLSTRVTKLVTRIDFPFQQDISIGNAHIKGNTQTLKEDVKSANENINILSTLNNAVTAKADAYYRALQTIIQNFAGIGEEVKTKLSKNTPDTAQKLITFLEGLLLGDGKHGITEKGVATLLKVITDNIESRNFEKGILGNGFGMWTDADGRSYAEFDYLDIRRAATFRNISILELKHIGGELGLTAGAMQVSKVERLGGIYRCYFDTTDGKRTVYQEFVAGDQARCQQFRPKADKSGMLTTKYYWRLVTAVGNDYIDLSISDCDTGSSEPEVGDNIIQLGYRGTDHPERQSAVILSAVTFDAPSQKFYQGINSYNLTNRLVKDEGYDSSTGVFHTNVYGNAYIGNKDVTDFFEYKNGKATFSGEAHFKQGSTGGENIQGILTSGANLILNSGFCGNYKTKELAEDTLLKEQTELYSPSMFGWNGDADVREDSDSMSGFSVAIKTFISQFIKMGIIPGDTYSFTCKAKGSSLTVRIGGAEKSFSLTNDYQIIKMTCTPTAGNVLELIGPCDVCEPMLVAGNTQATWQRSPLDVDRAFDIQLAMSYLTDALANDTRINGGLLLSTLIKVGRLKNGKWKDAAGMSGIYNDDNDVAFYAGGTFEDAIRTVMTYMGNPTYHPTDEELQAMAKYVVTHGGRTILNDAILRGIIYADGGILRNIRTPNGSLVITEDGNVSIVGKFETSLNGKKITIDPDLGRFTLSGERTLSDGSKVNADHVVIDINDLRHHDDTFNYVPNVSCFDYHPDGNIRKITSVTPSGIYIEGREADANSYATYDATGMDLTLYDKLSKQATTLSCWLIRGDSGPIPYIRSNTFPTYDQAPVGGVYLSGDVLKVKLK